jgi:hypothetical protein
MWAWMRMRACKLCALRLLELYFQLDYVPFDLLCKGKYSNFHLLIRYAESKREVGFVIDNFL